jgi:hypothetical protein
MISMPEIKVCRGWSYGSKPLRFFLPTPPIRERYKLFRIVSSSALAYQPPARCHRSEDPPPARCREQTPLGWCYTPLLANIPGMRPPRLPRGSRTVGTRKAPGGGSIQDRKSMKRSDRKPMPSRSPSRRSGVDTPTKTEGRDNRIAKTARRLSPIWRTWQFVASSLFAVGGVTRR